MQSQRSQFTHVPTVNHRIPFFTEQRSPFTMLLQQADSDRRDLVLRALEVEPMLAADAAPAGIFVEDLSRHIRALKAKNHRIHSKVLGWRDYHGNERRTTYYGLHRELKREFFTWGYEQSFIQAFEHLEASCKLIGFDINPQKRDLPLPEKLHLYHFLQSMVE